MFAVIRAGGRQYKVAASDVLEIYRASGEVGDTVTFGEVLMLGGPEGTTLGAPLLAGASVLGEIVEHRRGPKVIAFKKRRRKNSRRARGYRDFLTLVRITDILPEGATAKPKAAKTARPAKSDAPVDAVFTTPDGAEDDLKKINGIGPVMEGKLNAIGVTRLDQIAAFTAADVAKAEEALHLHGRFERDGWIKQAKALTAKKKDK